MSLEASSEVLFTWDPRRSLKTNLRFRLRWNVFASHAPWIQNHLTLWSVLGCKDLSSILGESWDAAGVQTDHTKATSPWTKDSSGNHGPASEQWITTVASGSMARTLRSWAVETSRSFPAFHLRKHYQNKNYSLSHCITSKQWRNIIFSKSPCSNLWRCMMPAEWLIFPECQYILTVMVSPQTLAGYNEGWPKPGL